MMTAAVDEKEGGRSKGMFHPLAEIFRSELSTYIGVLSEFIVKKQYSEVMKGGGDGMDRSKAMSLVEAVTDEVEVLIGKDKTAELKNRYIRITEDFFMEEKDNEQ